MMQNIRLSKNFTLFEMCKSDTAIRKGISNSPSDLIIKNLTTLTEKILQPVRDFYQLPIKINSGYRSPKLNVAVGGSKTSDHCVGFAADIEIPGISNYVLAKYIADNYDFKQIILEAYIPGVPDSGWVHVSYDPDNLKRQVLTAVFKNGKPQYSIGLNP